MAMQSQAVICVNLGVQLPVGHSFNAQMSNFVDKHVQVT